MRRDIPVAQSTTCVVCGAPTTTLTVHVGGMRLRVCSADHAREAQQTATAPPSRPHVIWCLEPS